MYLHFHILPLSPPLPPLLFPPCLPRLIALGFSMTCSSTSCFSGMLAATTVGAGVAAAVATPPPLGRLVVAEEEDEGASVGDVMLSYHVLSARPRAASEGLGAVFESVWVGADRCELVFGSWDKCESTNHRSAASTISTHGQRRSLSGPSTSVHSTRLCVHAKLHPLHMLISDRTISW